MADNISSADFDSIGAQQPSQPAQVTPSAVSSSPQTVDATAFDSIAPQQSQANGQSQQAQPEQNWFMDKVDQFNHSFDRMALGTMSRAGQAYSAVTGDPLTAYNAGIDQSVNQSDTKYNKAWSNDPHGVGSYLASGLGMAGSGAAYGSLMAPLLPETVAASPLATGTALGAGIGYLDPSKTGLETATKTVGGALLGGAVPLALKVGSSILGKWLNPAGSAIDTMAATIKGDPQAAEQLQGAINQGDNLSAGSVFPSWASKEAGLRPAKSVQDDIIRPRLLNQIENTKQGLLNSVGDMADSPMDQAAMKQGYNQLNNEFVTPNGEITSNAADAGIPDSLSNHAYVNDYLNSVKNGKSDAYKGIMDNSLAQLQAAKSAINSRLYGSGSELAPDESLGLNEALGKINPILQKSDNYNTANDLAQKFSIQKGYQDKLANLDMSKASLGDIHDALFTGDKGEGQFLNDVANTGGDPKLAQSTIYMAKKLEDSPLQKILGSNYAGAKADETGLKAHGSIGSTIINVVHDKLASRYSHALLDLTLNQNKWAPALQAALGQGTATARDGAFRSVLQNAASTAPVMMFNNKVSNVSAPYANGGTGGTGQ